jgi:hypothetical protein
MLGAGNRQHIFVSGDIVAKATWPEVVQQARRTAQDLKRRNKPALAHGPEGESVKGWLFHYLKDVRDPQGTNSPNDYDEYQEFVKLVLGVDGKIYMHEEGHYTPRYEAREDFNRIELASRQYLMSIEYGNGCNALLRLLGELRRS